MVNPPPQQSKQIGQVQLSSLSRGYPRVSFNRPARPLWGTLGTTNTESPFGSQSLNHLADGPREAFEPLFRCEDVKESRDAWDIKARLKEASSSSAMLHVGTENRGELSVAERDEPEKYVEYALVVVVPS